MTEYNKNQYYLDCDGRIFEHHTTEYIKNKMKEIGNYFESKEEAEKAVEKLMAWKRLKDKGFEFLWYESTPTGDSIEFYIGEWDKEATRDMDLLFGGEE